MTNAQPSWREFLKELHSSILPIYEEHEGTFDHSLIHGRMHICRCLVFSEFMCRYYHARTRLSPGTSWVRYAVAFHDSGRQANGPDFWEEDSAQRCADYLDATSLRDDAKTIGDLITKHGRSRWSIEKRIVHDADVLDIMRPCCGHGGRAGFKERSLRVLGSRDDREAQNQSIQSLFIEEAWQFIQAAEDRKNHLCDSIEYMVDVLDVLREMDDKCSLLSECFAK